MPKELMNKIINDRKKQYPNRKIKIEDVLESIGYTRNQRFYWDRTSERTKKIVIEKLTKFNMKNLYNHKFSKIISK